MSTLQLLQQSSFSLRLNFVTDFWCGLAPHVPSLSFQNPKPRYFSFVGFVIQVFSAFTFNPSLRSIQSVMEYMTLLAAALLPTTITQSSAYRVNYSPLASSSLSSSFSIMLLSNGDRFPPCGVPVGVSSYFPLTMTPAWRYLRISDSVSPS